MQYWWKLVLVGVYCVDWFVHESPNGESLAILRQEGMEGWVGLFKQLCEKRLKPNGKWMKRSADNLDLYVIGGVRENVVDFGKIRQRNITNNTLIWIDGHTDAEINETAALLPESMKVYLLAIDEIKFNDETTIHDSLHQVFQISESVSDTMNDLQKTHESHVNHVIIENQQENTNQTNGNATRRGGGTRARRRKRLTKAERLSQLMAVAPTVRSDLIPRKDENTTLSD